LPLVNVLPLRIQASEASGAAVRKIQNAINDMQEYEGLPYGRVQNIVRSGGQLFEVIFSVYYEEEIEHRVWELIDSSPDLPPDVCFCICSSDSNLKLHSVFLPVRLLQIRRTTVLQ
jgi:hypothetical protein